jgi:arylsulfatase A-like enzyme
MMPLACFPIRNSVTWISRRPGFLLCLGLAWVLSTQCLAAIPRGQQPNLVYILTDDLGYGDVQCLNPQRGKIRTPHLDRLAARGMVFTDAHSSSAVCTPTRYGILTGRYNWRSRLQSGVLYGYDAPLIAADRLTVAEMLRQRGYATACIGKWHLGMGLPEGQPAPRITEGPTARGFDVFYGISASLDMPPFAFIDGDRFTEPLTTEKKWVRLGPAAASFEAVDVLPTLTRKATEYIGEQAGLGRPFFLYLPLTSPHTPIVPSAEWQSKSGLGAYGDFVMETDWAVGEVLAALERAGVADNTLVIFTSDNGFSPHAKTAELEHQGHFPSASFRGYKADIWDGGHRVPFLVRWPARVQAGSRSDATICLTDFMATAADLLGVDLPANAAEDSFSMLPELLGTGRTQRDATVHHSINGNFAIRQGAWKLVLGPGSGGWGAPRDPEARKQQLPEIQLYDLANDVGETRNVQAEHPGQVARLAALLEQIVAHGRSTPGPIQLNDVPINIRKASGATPAK